MKKYEKPILKNANYYNLITKNKQILSDRKFTLLKQILEWRDQVARDEDESAHFVM